MSYMAAEQVISSLLRAHPDRRATTPPHLVVIYDRALFLAARAALGAEPVTDWLYADRPMRQLHVARHRPRVALLHTEIGAPLIAYLLQLLAACGLRSVLLVTSAGAVRPDLPVGALFVVESAVSDNGVTQVLAPGRLTFAASATAIGRLGEACRASGVAARAVRALSSDAFFRPAPPSWADTGESPDVVEMEAATTFAVAERCGLEAAAVGYVADVLADEWHRPQERYYPPDRLRLVEVVAAYADAC